MVLEIASSQEAQKQLCQQEFLYPCYRFGTPGEAGRITCAIVPFLGVRCEMIIHQYRRFDVDIWYT